jgi:hypothetical protein
MSQKKPRKRGRPQTVTLEKVNEVGALMGEGMPERFACLLVGINPETFGPAVSRNQEFRDALDKHHAVYIRDSLAFIKRGGDRDEQGRVTAPWTARAWVLERRYRPHFNRTDNHAITDNKGEQRGLMTEEEMRELSAMTRPLVDAVTARREKKKTAAA